jgi:hypothetical protein
MRAMWNKVPEYASMPLQGTPVRKLRKGMFHYFFICPFLYWI